MAKVRRVFEIAKDLGVTSKAIVNKCVAEGVPGITNHMSTVKIGLEQTIREWFSDSGELTAHTAVETADKVDLSQARRARRRGGAAGVLVEEAEGEVAAERPVAPPTAGKPISAPSPVAERPGGVKAQPIAAPAAPEPAVVTVAAPAPGLAVAAGAAPVAGAATAAHAGAAVAVSRKAEESGGEAAVVMRPVGRPNVPDRPATVKPAGPQLQKRQEAVLRGPKVVRIEQPDTDVLAPPRVRRPVGGGGPRPVEGVPTGGGREAPGGASRPRGPVRGREVETGVAPEPEGGDRQRGKRRSLSTRRGRSADGLPIGPTKFSEADLAELDARLNRATGFLKLRRRNLKKQSTGIATASAAVTGGKVEITEPITIKTLSAATGIKGAEIIKYLFNKGVMATINTAIDASTAMEIALEHEIELEVKEQQTAEQVLLAHFEKQETVDLRARPPVVTVLGHVDHGKTSLLDRIRAADVASQEAGGITQHVGAYRVTVKGNDGKDKTVVFLDTPGHEAFTSMRARGAGMTDVVVLVVAADDGVMPQTIESINHAKAAGVPIVVALNKIDKPEATQENIHRIYGQLAEHGLTPRDWGGNTEIVKVSATKGIGITELLEVLDYEAELLELKADYGGAARGAVIESQMRPGRGPVARVLVQQGKLKVGDFVVIGRAYGRVRDMTDDHGNSIAEAGPATPLELSGIDLIPDAGDKFYVTDTLQKAEDVARQYRESERTKQLASKTKVTLDNFADTIAAGGAKELRVVLKADVQGSIDVLRKSLGQLSGKEAVVKILHAAVGGINESDVLLAEASDAVIIGFHVVASTRARELAEQRGVDIRLYKVIYDVTDDLTKALEGLLEPEIKEQALGTAEVREVFKISKLGVVAGCFVLDGVIQRGGKIRVTRDDVVVTEDRGIESLRRVKEDVREVRAGTECGIRIAGFEDVKVGDKLICYQTVSVSRKLL